MWYTDEYGRVITKHLVTKQKPLIDNQLVFSVEAIPDEYLPKDRKYLNPQNLEIEYLIQKSIVDQQEKEKVKNNQELIKFFSSSEFENNFEQILEKQRQNKALLDCFSKYNFIDAEEKPQEKESLLKKKHTFK